VPDVLPGWCTNIFPSHSAAELGTMLRRVAPCLPAGTPVGLWLADEVLGDDPVEAVQPLRATLRQLGAPLLGLNAFPQNDFHADRVKDAVYLPGWDDPDRQRYTLRAAEAATALCDGEKEIGITTVPIGWPSHGVDLKRAVDHLGKACRQLAELRDRTGTQVFIAMEPEPGCILPTASALAAFLLKTDLQWACREGMLRACLDACHLAVENECPSAAVEALRTADNRVGRVQIKSAPQAHGPDAIEALRALAEPRWMHQTCITRGNTCARFDDLPDAADEPATGIWRTHFHVPVHRPSFGPLASTQPWIESLLRAVAATGDRPPVEVETYAWNVLPNTFRLPTVQAEVARELEWTSTLLERIEW